MIVTPEERDDLLSGYVLGLLGRDETAAIEQLITRDAAAARELAALRAVTDLIALDVPLRRADPSLRQRVLTAARADRAARASLESEPRRLRGLLRDWLHLPLSGSASTFTTIAAASIAVVAMWWAVDLQGDLDHLRKDTAALSAVVQADAKRLEQLVTADEAAGAAQEVAVPSDDSTTALTLALDQSSRERELMAAVTLDERAWAGNLEPTDAGHGATARYLWSTSVNAGVLIAQGLPDLPLGSVYQVWLDDGVTVIPGDTFAPNPRGDATVLVLPDGQVQPLFISVAVSPVGGSTTIVQPVVLFGRVDR